ncbi:MAG: peptidoglycan DD-metalloendopeptidase family protein [Clostridia bacterium]|nr:peptidoglycan DD-metalloendopeptidase family protein [Clostridia bacterium]
MLKSKKRLFSVFSAIVAAALLFTSVAFPVTGASTDEQIAALREKNKELQSQIEAAEEKMAAIKSDINSRQEYADELSGQIADLQTQIDVLDQSIDALQVKIDALLVDIEEKNNIIASLEKQVAEAENKVAECNDRITATYDRLKERLRSIYVNGRVSELELLLSSDDFATYLASLELMNSMAKHDDALIKSIEADIRDLRALQDALEADKLKVEESRVALEEAKSDLEANQAEIEENKAVVAGAQQAIRDKWSEVQAVINELDAQSDSYKALVNSYQKQMAEAADEIEDLLRRQSQQGSISYGTGEISGAGFVWPLQYSGVYTTTEYGQNGHGGLDITCNGASQLNKEIVAVADGVVTTATCHWSYGNYIVIDHGNGLSTLYAHCNNIYVSVGQRVSQGEAIGIVGNTGYSFGAHVHFEVHVNGARRNPRNYL